MSLSISMRLVCALALLGQPVSRAPLPRPPDVATESDSVSIAEILGELHAFYRDLDDDNPTSLVTHFYPAKVTARFAAPVRDPRWLALVIPVAEPEADPGARKRCVPRAMVVLVGNWGRVRARRCAGAIDELWFYRMSNRWKIIHLVFGAASLARALDHP